MLLVTDPASMYAILLMSASHRLTLLPSASSYSSLLALKSRALSAVNAALACPSRRTSDATIGAVAKLAAFEALAGNGAAFATHMRGLREMLKLRGGFGELGMEGLLERMILWIEVGFPF